MMPVIGLTGGIERAVGVAEERVVFGVPDTYVEAIQRSHALPLILPTIDDAAGFINRIDALILTGGPDVDPSRYGVAEVHPKTETSQRDGPEMVILSEALRREMPVLGICRGMQVLGVMFGGRLHQHLPDALGHTGHHPEGAAGEHEVRIVRGSRLSGIFGETRVVNSQHHQGVSHPGSLRVSATTADGLIEGVESPGPEFVVGVQWHPERRVQDDPLFAALAAAAAAYQDQRESLVPPARSPETTHR